MTTGRHKLKPRFVETVNTPGRYSDGHGLYLVVRQSGSKAWSFVWIRKGIRREMGLGGAAGPKKVTLANARFAAETARIQAGEGLDPRIERDRETDKTFGEVADLVLQQLSKGWKSKSHARQWERALKETCQPIRTMSVREINTTHVLKVLGPVWKATPETGRRLRSRIERVLDFAHTHGWREGDNPARWRGHLENVLTPQTPESRKHFPAMPFKDVPALMRELRHKDNIPAMALEFTILTAARTGETLGAQWSEIDFENALWTVPASRMKMKTEHTVPLTDRALEILRKLYDARVSDYVFPGQKLHRPFSNMAMTMVLRRMGFGHYTVHGFRSAFRDFAGDKTRVAREVAEAALAHRVGNAVEAAYRRGDALDKRRGLMSLWTDYCSGVHSGDVVRLHG